MGLLSILLVILSQVFVATLGVKLESESNAAVVQDGNYIHTRLAYDISRAQRIVEPNLGVSSSQLTLGIIENGVEVLYTYSMSGDTLTLSDGSTTDMVHSDSVTIPQFVVTRIGNSDTVTDAKDTVKISYTVQSVYQRSSGTDSLSYEISLGLR